MVLLVVVPVVIVVWWRYGGGGWWVCQKMGAVPELWLAIVGKGAQRVDARCSSRRTRKARDLGCGPCE